MCMRVFASIDCVDSGRRGGGRVLPLKQVRWWCCVVELFVSRIPAYFKFIRNVETSNVQALLSADSTASRTPGCFSEPIRRSRGQHSVKGSSQLAYSMECTSSTWMEKKSPDSAPETQHCSSPSSSLSSSKTPISDTRCSN